MPLCKLKRLHGFTYFNRFMVCGRRSAAENEAGREAEEKELGKEDGGRRREAAMEGSVATRKVRAKRFVECFMESFRIVDFLSPIAPGWIYDGRRTRKRTSAVSPTCAARPPARATENIKGYYLNSRKVFAFCAGERGAGPRCFPESDRDPLSFLRGREQTAVKVFPCR